MANLRVAVESQRIPPSVRGSTFKNFGLALLDNGDTAEAEIQLRAALEQTPPDLRAYCALAAVYRQTGRIAEASRAADDCRSHPSSPEEAHY